MLQQKLLQENSGNCKRAKGQILNLLTTPGQGKQCSQKLEGEQNL